MEFWLKQIPQEMCASLRKRATFSQLLSGLFQYVVALVVLRQLLPEGSTQMTEEVRWGIAAGAALGAVLVIQILWELIKAPVELQRRSQSDLKLVKSRLGTALEQLDERLKFRNQKAVFINLAVDAEALAVPDVTEEQAKQFLARAEAEITPIIDPYQLTLFRKSTWGLFDPNVQVGGNRSQEVLLRTANRLYYYSTRLTVDGISPQTGLHSS